MNILYILFIKGKKIYILQKYQKNEKNHQKILKYFINKKNKT